MKASITANVKTGSRVLVQTSYGKQYEATVVRETATLVITDNGTRFAKKDLFGWGHKAYIRSVITKSSL